MFCGFRKGIASKICMLCFILIMIFVCLDFTGLCLYADSYILQGCLLVSRRCIMHGISHKQRVALQHFASNID